MNELGTEAESLYRLAQSPIHHELGLDAVNYTIGVGMTLLRFTCQRKIPEVSSYSRGSLTLAALDVGVAVTDKVNVATTTLEIQLPVAEEEDEEAEDAYIVEDTEDATSTKELVLEATRPEQPSPGTAMS